MKKHLQSENLFSVFFTLNTRKETKHFLEKRTLKNETDEMLICNFISEHCDPDKSYNLTKSFEFQNGFFVPHFELIELNNSMFDIIDANELSKCKK